MIKKLFATPKKAIISILGIAATLAVVGTGTAFAVNRIAETTSIGSEKAQMFAYADAGVDPVKAQNIKTDFDYEQGQFIYEVEFIADGTEYEYWIHAKDGSVVKKELEVIENKGLEPSTGQEPSSSAEPSASQKAPAKISKNEARAIALKDAGVDEKDISIKEEKLDINDGTAVYEIEFTKGNIKYEYEINAETGAIFSKGKQTSRYEQSDPKEPTGTKKNNTSTKDVQNVTAKTPTVNSQAYISADKAKSIAVTNAGLKLSDVRFTEVKFDDDDRVKNYDLEFFSSTHKYEYEINAENGKILDKSVEAFKKQGSNTSTSPATATGTDQTSKSYISADKARSIALAHAKKTASTVSFSKTKLDQDDGQMVYDIEFYSGNVEYEYEIDAYTGKIVEFDKE